MWICLQGQGEAAAMEEGTEAAACTAEAGEIEAMAEDSEADAAVMVEETGEEAETAEEIPEIEGAEEEEDKYIFFFH